MLAVAAVSSGRAASSPAGPVRDGHPCIRLGLE
jgi:hypothetical protein